jgi:hypothetical protein
MYSVIVPVYRNEEYVPLLIEAFTKLSRNLRQRFGMRTEFVFVVDGSPDQSHRRLSEALASADLEAQLLLHARNFGAFAAIRTGLRAARGDYFGVIAADLQEPPELLVKFLENLLEDEHDIVIGVRETRDDPTATRLLSNVFWTLYRKLVVPEIPPGGVDVFGCNKRVRDELINLQEANSSLVSLVFWLGFRRKEVRYARSARRHGKSAWTLGKKITYFLDSVFAFTDLPIRMLTAVGICGVTIAAVFGLTVALSRMLGAITEPGYAAIVVAVAFFGALNTLATALVGAYTWRAYENTKNRPLAIVQSRREFCGQDVPGGMAERVFDRQELARRVGARAS